MKRIISLMVSFVMVFSIITVPAAADATGINDRTEKSVTIKINPLYQATASPKELAQLEKELSEKEASLSAIKSAKTYTTIEDAGTALREAMKVRKQDTVICFEISEEELGDRDIPYELYECAMRHTGDPKGGDYLRWQENGIGWETLQESVSDGVVKLTISYYIMNFYTTVEQETAVDEKVKEVMESLALEGKTEYEKTKAIYDYICANVIYDYDNLEDGTYDLKHTAYAALINGTSVCQGYALLFYRLALEAGLDNRIIVGTGANQDHGWNIVRIDDKYYNLDTTWDAANVFGDDYYYFLRANNTFQDHQRWEEYDTADFHAAYPMAERDYGGTRLTDLDVEPVLEYETTEYDGTEKTPKVTIEGLTEKTDFVVAYYDNVDAIGLMPRVEIYGIGDYTGILTRYFTIMPKDISDMEAFLEYSTVIYNGGAWMPKVTIPGLVEDYDYFVEYHNNIEPGTAKVIVHSLPGCYQGEKILYFTIAENPAAYNGQMIAKDKAPVLKPNKVKKLKVTSKTRKKMVVTYQRNKEATGYQITYALNKKFTKGKKNVTVSKNKTVKKTIGKLKSGKTYYVKVRAYKKYGKDKIYGSYSKAKKIKIK